MFIRDDHIIQNDKFSVYVKAGLKWSEEMKQDVQLLTCLFDNEINFAVIGEGVYVPIFEEERSSFQKMSDMVRESCLEINKLQPDYAADQIEGNLTLLSVNGSVFSVIREEEPELPEYLLYRQKILDSCRDKLICGFVLGNTK